MACVPWSRDNPVEEDNPVEDLIRNIVAEKVVTIESRLTALENQLPQLSSVFLSLEKLDNDLADLRVKVQTNADIDSLAKVQVSDVLLPAVSAPQDHNDLVLATNEQPPKHKSNDSHNSQSDSLDQYEIEASIYGLIGVPNLTLRFGACFLIVVFYILTAGLIYIIHDSMVEDMMTTRNELYDSSDTSNTRPLCKQVFNGDDHIWDCSPDSLVGLMDFDFLDLDGDGIWSLAEARELKFVHHFRSFMEVALEQDDLLASMFPPVEPVLDQFCSMALRVGRQDANVMNFLSASEQVAMFETSGRVTPDILHQCEIPSELGRKMSDQNLTKDRKVTADRNTTIVPLAFSQYSCLLDAFCGNMPLTPGITSELQFYEATSHMSYVPRFLHEHLSEKMLRPCRLLDPELCANADVQEHTLLEDVWPDLRADQAIQKCNYWVSKVCPEILGEDFTAFQARMDVACGKRKYNVVRKSRRLSMPDTGLDSGAADLQCQDPIDGGKALLTSFIQMLYEQRPFYRYLAWGEEAAFGVPRGTVENQINCAIAGSLFQDQNFDVRDPVTNRSRMVSDVVGSVCPMTVCKRHRNQSMPMGCPVHCVHTADQAYNVTDPFRKSLAIGEYTQVGLCDGFHTELDATSGALKISRLMEIPQGLIEHCEMVLHLNKTARVYVTTWNLPMREETTAISGSCIGDHLMIDGVKYCTTQRPAPVTLEPTPHGYTVMLWTTCRTCGPFNYDSEGYEKWSPTGFELLIAEVVIPTEHLLVTVDFEMHRWYWSETNGVTTPLFRIFLVMIMLVWIGYLGEEWFKILRYTKFIMQEFQQFHATRVGCIVLLVIPRICVLFFVLYTGILLLATANSYIDLVLNSVALAFVLEFDEYLFVMAVPPSVKDEVLGRGVIKLKSLGIERWYKKNFQKVRTGYETSVFLRMMTFIVIAIMVVLGLYQTDWLGSPNFDKVADIYDCICALKGDHCPAF